MNDKPPDWSNKPATCPCCRLTRHQCRFEIRRGWNRNLGDAATHYWCQYCNSWFVWDNQTGEILDIESNYGHPFRAGYEKKVDVVHEMVEANRDGIRVYVFTTTWKRGEPSYLRGYITKVGKKIAFKREDTGDVLTLDARTGRGEGYRICEDDLKEIRKQLRLQLCARRAGQPA